MGTDRKLTSEQVREIADRRERGWSYARLAARYGVSPGAIHYRCLREGAVSPRTRDAGKPKGPQIFTGRDGRVQRRFTPEEDACIRDLALAGKNTRQICEALGRAPTSIKIRLLTLALHEEQIA